MRLQIILTRMKDLQLAMVIVRVYEADQEKQITLQVSFLRRQLTKALLFLSKMRFIAIKILA